MRNVFSVAFTDGRTKKDVFLLKLDFKTTDLSMSLLATN